MNQSSILRSTRSAHLSNEIPEPIADEVRRYDEHLRDVRGLAARTRSNHCRVITQLLRHKFGGGAIDMLKLRSSDVRHFVARQCDARLSHSHASQLASALRSYFRYRAVCGDAPSNLSAVLSSPVQWQLSTLPRALKPEEVQRLLSAFTNVRWPKRGYAIVRCALDLGLRAGEIAHLAIDDIDWRNGTVTLKGTKSRSQNVLPLPMQTGRALADYLQHERPSTRSPAIFVRRLGTQDLPITSAAVQKVIGRACQRVGLAHAGAHALRHTLACRLVQSGSSLKEVADVLRHRSLETSRIYAKLDTPKLACVALPWPGSRS